MSAKPPKKPRRRLICATTAAFAEWVASYAEYVQLTTSDLVAQALLRHADATGYSGVSRPPQRLDRPRHNTYRPPGPWPERGPE